MPKYKVHGLASKHCVAMNSHPSINKKPIHILIFLDCLITTSLTRLCWNFLLNFLMKNKKKVCCSSGNSRKNEM